MSTEIRDEFYKTAFTLKGRIFHPNLLTTREKTSQSGNVREIYDVMFAWNVSDPSNQATIQAINAFLGRMTQTLFPGVDPRAIYNPIKKFETYQRKDYKPNPEYLRGCAWVNAETGKDMAPVVVDQRRQPVMSEAEVYSGRNAVVNFTFYPQVPKPGANAATSNRGFGVNLAAVMLLDGGNKEGGTRQVNVDTIFGGFAADMGIQSGSNEPANNTPQPNWNQPNGNGNGFV